MVMQVVSVRSPTIWHGRCERVDGKHEKQSNKGQAYQIFGSGVWSADAASAFQQLDYAVKLSVVGIGPGGDSGDSSRWAA